MICNDRGKTYFSDTSLSAIPLVVRFQRHPRDSADVNALIIMFDIFSVWSILMTFLCRVSSDI